MKQFTLIIPVLNEVDNIEPLLQRIGDISQIFTFDPEILFVDDGSDDGTCEAIRDYGGRLRVRLLQREKCSGLAGAVLYGATRASHDTLLVMDGDLSHSPESIPELIQPLLSGKYDLVIGSRYTEGGSVSGWPCYRRVMSRTATIPAYFLTQVSDPLSGFFAVKKDVLTTLHCESGGFKILFELLQKHNDNITLKEVPIEFCDRQKGSSKMSGHVIFAYIRQLIGASGMAIEMKEVPYLLFSACIIALFDASIYHMFIQSGIQMNVAHIVGFLMSGHLFYLLALRYIMRDDQGLNMVLQFRVYRYLIVILLAGLFLRGGLLASLDNHDASQLLTTFALGGYTAIIWLFFVASLSSVLTGKKIPYSTVTLGIILYSILLRAVYLGNIELIQEEAYYWNYAQHMAAGYLDHPPVVAVFIWLGTTLLGDTEAGIRLGAFICWFITAYYSHGLTRRIFGAKAAIHALLLVAILPVFFGAALVMTPDSPLLACWSATLYYLYRALVDKKQIHWLWTGVAFGLGLSAKYTIALILPAVLLFILIDKKSRHWLKSPMPYIAVVLAIVFFSPVIWWNYEHDWASFLFQSKNRIADVTMFTTHKLLLSILVLLTPTGAITVFLMLFPHHFGLHKRGKSAKWQVSYFFTFIMILLPLATLVFISLTREVKLNWTGPIWLAAIPLMATSLVSAYYGKGAVSTQIRYYALGWQKTIIPLILVYGAALHYLSIGLPGVPYVTNNILLGWDDLAKKVEMISTKQGGELIVVGMDKYRIASGIAFYRQKEAKTSSGNVYPLATGRHLFDLESLMYRYWHPSTLFINHDVLVVSHSKEGLHPDLFRDKADKMSEVGSFSIEKQEKIIATYYYRVLTGYKPQNDNRLSISNMNQTAY